MKNAIKKMPLLFLTCLLFCAALLAPVGGGKVSAATDAAPSSIDETNVLDDLKGSTLNGKEFNKDDFAQSDIRDPQIISFVEYGYSFYANRQEDFGLYVYIYNPRVQAFDDDPTRNQILFKAGELASDKYDLKFLNYSTEVGYEGLFYKYKVALTDTERNKILSSLQRTERIYKVTELELVTHGAVTSYKCATTYTYKGFAQGYGSELAENESTLTCSVDGFEDYIAPRVHQTVYRPRGDYSLEKDYGGSGQLRDGNQPQLNSCYFRIPDKYFTQYGELTKAVCEWYEYQTKPIFVTTDIFAYNQLHLLYGAPLTNLYPTHDQGVIVMSWGNEWNDWNLGSGIVKVWHKTPYLWASNLGEFNAEPDLTGDNYYETYDGYRVSWPGGDIEFDEWLKQRFTNLAGVIFIGNNIPFYEATVSSEDLKTELLQNSEHLGGKMLAGQYSETLFTDTVDAGRQRGFNHKEIDLKKNDSMIWNDAIEQSNFLDFESILEDVQQKLEFQKCITITESDLSGSDTAISEKLLIAQEDVADLKKQFETAEKNGEVLVLLRYATTNYHSGKAIAKIADVSDKNENKKDNELIHRWLDEYHYDNPPYDSQEDIRANGYLAQETVFLDFDIISLWFATDDAETEIPVVMNPQDVISSLQSGVSKDPTPASNDAPWYIWLILSLLIIAVIIVLIIFFPVLRPIFTAIIKGIVFIILLPFKLIAMAIKKISEAAKKRKIKKKTKPPKRPKPPNPKGITKEAGSHKGTEQYEQHIVVEVHRPLNSPAAKKKPTTKKAPGKNSGKKKTRSRKK